MVNAIVGRRIMETYVLTKDYKHLKAGDTTKRAAMCRDSGYLCHLWHDGTKPLARDVSSLSELKEEFEIKKKRVAELEMLIQKASNDLNQVEPINRKGTR
jgi:hypothetical protein